MRKPVFVPQVEPRESVEELIGEWKEEDINLPHWNWCAICCVRMIVLGLGLEAPDMIDMYNTATEKYGAYRMVDGKILGAYHRELARYVKGEFCLKARALRRQPTANVAKWVSRGYYFVASVSSDIRKHSTEAPKRQNGHLVLVYGVRETLEGRFFVLHNSAGYSRTNTQSEVLVSEERFAQCFSGNGLIISSGQS